MYFRETIKALRRVGVEGYWLAPPLHPEVDKALKGELERKTGVPVQLPTLLVRKVVPGGEIAEVGPIQGDLLMGERVYITRFGIRADPLVGIVGVAYLPSRVPERKIEVLGGVPRGTLLGGKKDERLKLFLKLLHSKLHSIATGVEISPVNSLVRRGEGCPHILRLYTIPHSFPSASALAILKVQGRMVLQFIRRQL